MKSIVLKYPSCIFGMILLALGTLSGCCDAMVTISGKVSDATTGAALDGVRLSLFVHDKRDVATSLYEYSDSTGYFLLYDFVPCGKTDYFLIASKFGYESQSKRVEYNSDVEFVLVPE